MSWSPAKSFRQGGSPRSSGIRAKEAIKHEQELLRLNPNDNLSLRYDLASCLLEIRDDAGFAALVSQWLRTLAAGSLVAPYEQATTARARSGSTRARSSCFAATALDPQSSQHSLARSGATRMLGPS